MAATPPSHLAPDLPQVIYFIVARALRKKPEERYQSAADFARDLRAAIPEVRAAEAVAAERADAQTVPQASLGATGEVRTMPMPEMVLELRPSPRFDAGTVLERLAVRRPDDPAVTQAVIAAPRRARLDPARMLLVVAYGAALIGALVIAFA